MPVLTYARLHAYRSAQEVTSSEHCGWIVPARPALEDARIVV
jgi:hypothetical protein